MALHRLLPSLLLTSLLTIDGYADSIEKQSCGCASKPGRITARHIESGGIGYNQGCSTLETFFSPNEVPDNRWTPFIDLRGHVFNNGRLAANAGIGFRYLSLSHVWGPRLWGVNAYYDYRNTKHSSYRQAAIGLESLGETWDFRLNGYLPFGHKKSSLYDVQFDHFAGNAIIQSEQREYAMKGANFEVGAHVEPFKWLPLYLAAGPYYLNGKHSTWGGEARVAFDCYDYFRIEAFTSYDHLFKWTGQGQLSVVFPLGRKRDVQHTKCHSCRTMLALSERAVQKVDRQEIIPVDHKHFRSIAIDPITNQPFFILFVDNQSHSDGTFESPYPTLALAQNNSDPHDIIYVFEGDGTTTNMDAGFEMKDYQHLWGSGVAQELQTNWGLITIPALTSGLPLIKNPLGSAVISLGNGCEVSGIHVDLIGDRPDGILGPGLILGSSIHHNQIDMSNTSYGRGIAVESVSNNQNDDSTWSIYQNTINGNISTDGIFVSSGRNNTNNNSTWNIYQNRINGDITNVGISARSRGNSQNDNSTWNIYQNRITGNISEDQAGIYTISIGNNVTDNSTWNIYQNNFIGDMLDESYAIHVNTQGTNGTDSSTRSIYQNRVISNVFSNDSVGIYIEFWPSTIDNSILRINQNIISGEISDGTGIHSEVIPSLSGTSYFSLINNQTTPYPITLDFNGTDYELINYGNHPTPTVNP